MAKGKLQALPVKAVATLSNRVPCTADELGSRVQGKQEKGNNSRSESVASKNRVSVLLTCTAKAPVVPGVASVDVLPWLATLGVSAVAVTPSLLMLAGAGAAFIALFRGLPRVEAYQAELRILVPLRRWQLQGIFIVSFSPPALWYSLAGLAGHHEPCHADLGRVNISR